MKYIGVDLGSSFIKVVLMDLDQGKIVDQDKMATPEKESYENPNYFEIPAKKIVEIVKQLVDHYTKEYPDVEGLIISTQMHGFVYAIPEKENMYISWQDMRCMNRMPGMKKTYLQWMEEQITPEEMENHGVYLKPSLGICNLYTLLEENKELRRDGELYTLGSYVIYSLTGNNICHISNAAPLGLADVAHYCWNKEILNRFHLGHVKLPKLAENDYEVCGRYESNGHYLKVHPDYGDMQIAITGSGIRAGDVVVNVATGAQVIRYDTKFKPGEYEIRPYLEGSYLYTISNMPSGRNLDVLIRFIKETINTITNGNISAQDVWKSVHKAKLIPDEDLRVETSFYRNPFFPDGGSIKGITHANLHLETIFYSAFRDMSETYWRFIQKLGADEKEIERLVCAGGVNWKTPEIRQMLSKISGKESCLSPMADEALAGMYQLSLLCSGKCGNLEECRAFSLQK